jgi:hypothetical protein
MKSCSHGGDTLTTDMAAWPWTVNADERTDLPAKTAAPCPALAVAAAAEGMDLRLAADVAETVSVAARMPRPVPASALAPDAASAAVRIPVGAGENAAAPVDANAA